jgi:glyoxylase-like metal-dependent hydrolase (beta-lactamase superfamily II)
VSVAERVETHGEVVRHHTARRVPGPMRVWVSVYVVDGVLIDSGMSHARRAVARFLGGQRIHACLTTHEHEDHVGNHELLGPAVEIHAPPIARRFLGDGTPSFPVYRRFFWGFPRAKGIPAKPAEGTIRTATRAFRVIATPGHSDDHVAYLDEASGALFSGDAYMGKFRAARLAEDVATEVASLRRMADLDPNALYPAHGPILERPRKKLLDAADHFDDLRRRAHALREKGLGAPRVARDLLGREPIITYVSMGEFSNLNMARNLLRAPPPS